MAASEFDDTYLIYSALLDHLFDRGPLAVNFETQQDELSAERKHEYVTFSSPEMVADFSEKNKTQHVILRAFTSRFSPALTYDLTHEQFFSDPEDGDSKGLPDAAALRNSTVLFSAIGFDKNRSQALLRTTLSCGENCITDSLYVMKKTAFRRWVVEKERDMAMGE
jgi:hypothetical protein